MHVRRWSTLMSLTLGSLVAGCWWSARIEPFGEAKLSALCADTKRCGARGDSVLNLLKKKGQRLYLGKDKGAEQLLGKVAPDRDVSSVLKTCGKEIAVEDVQAAPAVIRQFRLGNEGKRAVRERLHAYLAKQVEALAMTASAELSLKSVVDAIDLEQVSWLGETYWLSDAAFEKRAAQCGEEERVNIIYSLTVLSPSEAFQADLARKLSEALTDKLASAQSDAGTTDAGVEPSFASQDAEAAPADAGAASVNSRYDTIARDVVRTLARDTRVVAALGFDDP